MNPVRNSSGALNPAEIILELNPTAKQWGIISNGVKVHRSNATRFLFHEGFILRLQILR